MPVTPDIEEFFGHDRVALDLARAVIELIDRTGAVESRVTKSQVAFRSRKGFAYLWCPGRYVASDVPVVLSIALPERLDSSRFKSVVHPAPRVWMHHLELRGIDQVDAEVADWLATAHQAAS